MQTFKRLAENYTPSEKRILTSDLESFAMSQLRRDRQRVEEKETGKVTTVLEPITFRNSTVDGRDWTMREFASLGFAATDLYPDDSYACGCLKYLSSALDSDPTCGHRVRSKFKQAKPVKMRNVWMWEVLQP